MFDPFFKITSSGAELMRPKRVAFGYIHNQKGISIIEVMLTLSIGVFVLTATLSLARVLLTQSQDLMRSGSGYQAQTLLVEYFTDKIQGIGGGIMRPWAAVRVEDNDCPALGVIPACNGSDRLYLAKLKRNINSACISIEDSTATEIIFHVNELTGECDCDILGYANSQIFVESGLRYQHLKVLSVDASACIIQTEPGFLAHIDTAIVNWRNALVMPTDISIIFLDTDTQILKLAQDLNGDQIFSQNEILEIADQVYDFQVSLGFDRSPEDGVISHGPNAAQDEWFGNHTNEQMGSGVWSGVERGQLRALMVDILIGDRDRTRGGNTLRVQNGTQKSFDGILLNRVNFSVYFKSLGIFQ